MLPQFRPHSSANEERAYFAKRLVHFLREKNMNQSELARQVPLSRDAISSYVRARSLPEPANLKRIADVLGVEPSDMTMPAEHSPELVGHHLLMAPELPAVRDAAGGTNVLNVTMRGKGIARVIIQADLPVQDAMELVMAYNKIIEKEVSGDDASASDRS